MTLLLKKISDKHLLLNVYRVQTSSMKLTFQHSCPNFHGIALCWIYHSANHSNKTIGQNNEIMDTLYN